ncbi:hypothetical protein [Streptomyces sp. NBC_00233]|uniref:hypothetical protein n=1 Tax=Streptomyces sp. NBC_00233 TaxID=2975686 RepID=UPI002258AF35|nr:hypothetical protein [Streptomyces sp. NBC_00233]MCX5232015.1 hypothetical protein [Streptomyces sp. NBC_00233]
MPTTEEAKAPEGPEIAGTTGVSPRRDDRGAGRGTDHGTDRGGIAVAAVLLLACAGFVAFGVLDSENAPPKPPGAAPTAEVTYEVLGEGTADIAYRAAGDDGEAPVVAHVGLPWRKTVSLPAGAPASVHVTLDERGGTASCTLTVRGEHVQRATATGAFGRTACSGELPAREGSADPQRAY